MKGEHQYKHIAYGVQLIVKAEPKNRAEDAMHYLLTGQLKGGRTLDDVVYSLTFKGPKVLQTA